MYEKTYVTLDEVNHFSNEFRSELRQELEDDCERFEKFITIMNYIDACFEQCMFCSYYFSDFSNYCSHFYVDLSIHGSDFSRPCELIEFLKELEVITDEVNELYPDSKFRIYSHQIDGEKNCCELMLSFDTFEL